MKKLIMIFFSLCILYFTISYGKGRLGNGHHLSYFIHANNQKFEIEETYHKKSRDKIAGYFLEVRVQDTLFPIVINTTTAKKKIIEDISYFANDTYQCIYVTGNFQLDVLCQNDQVIYPYQSIVGVDAEVDAFVVSLENYDASQFIDRKSIVKRNNGISIYDSWVSNHIIGVEHYKGISLFDSANSFQDKKLFLNDSYQKNLDLFYQQYYLVADYNQKYEFHEFYMIHMRTKKETKIISNEAISFDSYIQGVVDNQVYLLDRTNKKQYQIHLSDKTVRKVGDVNSGVQIYQNGSWKTETMHAILKQDVYFTDSIPEGIMKKEDTYYDVTSNYYYLFEAIQDGYLVYRVCKEAPSIRYYITTVSEKQTVYIDDYIYWKEKDKIYYYHDTIGTRVIVQMDEFAFNSNLQFGVYTK